MRLSWHEMGRRLDAVAPRVTGPIGVVAGLVVGLGAMLVYPLGLALFAGLLVGAGALVLTGHSVSVPVSPVLVPVPRQLKRGPDEAEGEADGALDGAEHDEAEADDEGEGPPGLVFPPPLVNLAGGRFRMGGTENDDEQPVHEVTVSAFACMVVPVTRALYARVMGEDTGFPDRREDDPPVERDEQAANNVSWLQAVGFCNRLSALVGLEPCYRQADDGDWVWRREADGYRLPTEAEWEYACRAGAETRYCFGDDEDRLAEYAWFGMDWDAGTQPVGRKEANAWGLYDVHGNVWEWCWDWYDPGLYASRAGTEVVDPAGPMTNDLGDVGKRRLLRGGSFGYSARDARCADRFWFEPGNGGGFNGFRCVRGQRRQH